MIINDSRKGIYAMNDFLEKLRQTISHYGKKIWTWFLAKSRRYQLWRWLVVIFLASFFSMSIYLTFVAKTSNVKGLKNALEQATEIYVKMIKRRITLCPKRYLDFDR